MLDKASEYHFYFGRRCEKPCKLVQYANKPDSTIGSEGMQFELTKADFNGDGKLDLASPSFELGVGAIVASLFSQLRGSRYHVPRLW